MKISKWIAALVISTSLPSSGQEREWRSRDGRTIVASGVGATVDGVVVARGDGSRFTIPFASLNLDDAKWALQNLKFNANDQVEASGVTKGQSVNRFERGTGNYAILLEIYRISGNVYQASGSATEITEKVKESGRSVSIELTPTLGTEQSGAVAVELYTITGQGPDKKIAKMTGGVFSFSPGGSVVVLETDVVEKFSGWAILVRSLNTGRVISASASMNHFTDFVLSEVPEAVDFSDAIKRFKEKIIANL